MNPEAINLAKNLVATKPKTIDVDRHYSHGKNGVKNFVGEQNSALTMSLSVASAAASTSVSFAIGSLANSIYKDNAEAIAALGVDAIIDDGAFHTVETDKDITATSNDSGRTIAQMIKYIANNPTRIASVAIQSQTSAGAADVSNYTASIAQIFVSPFHTPEKSYLPLRKFQSNRANSPEFADVNFLKQNWPVIWSSEHFTVFTIKPGTTLNFTFTIGMQDSSAQRLYRQVKDVDRTLMPYRQ